MSLSVRQKEVLDFIREHLKEQGYPPSYREIGSALDIGSTNAVRDHILALERKGYIERKGSRSRSLRLTIPEDEQGPPPSRAVHVPVLGSISAGTPLLARDNVEEYIEVDHSMIRRGYEYFALPVVGDSMINAGILHGDTLLVRRAEEASNGTIVVALLDEEATVKRYYREDDRVRLQPENDQLDPIYLYDEEGVGKAVQGVVVAVIRLLDV